MNPGYIQNIRYKLQKRVRRLNSVGYSIYHSTLHQFFGFINRHRIFQGIIEELIKKNPEAKKYAEEILTSRQQLVFSDESELTAVSYFVLIGCIEAGKKHPELEIGLRYGGGKEYDSCISKFNEIFLEPFYEYLDEQIDDQGATLTFLMRYKHKCESYQRNYLYDIWNNNTPKGEELLARHLYEYLFDQGLELIIEPSSVSGKVDLIASQNSKEPLIVDAKIFNPDKSKDSSYIARGLKQIYLYTTDYNKPFGYLIIFNTSKEDLRLALKNQEPNIQFVIHNDKTIFIVQIDIFPHDEPASKRGRLKPIEITEEYLIQVVEKDDQEEIEVNKRNDQSEIPAMDTGH